MRGDDVLEVLGGIYIRYFASAYKGAVIQVQGGGIYSTFLRGNVLRFDNEIKSAFCNVCSMVISVVIMGACTQAVDTVFLFLDSVPFRKNT